MLDRIWVSSSRLLSANGFDEIVSVPELSVGSQHILSNTEAIAVNQPWNGVPHLTMAQPIAGCLEVLSFPGVVVFSGSPGQLLLTDRASFASPLNAKGYYEYPAQLGQSRGWKNVPGMGPVRATTAAWVSA